MSENLLKELIEKIDKLDKRVSLNREVFNSEEAAEYLRMGYGTLLQLARIGQIEHVKNGTSYIFKKEYLDRWLERNKKEVI